MLANKQTFSLLENKTVYAPNLIIMQIFWKEGPKQRSVNVSFTHKTFQTQKRPTEKLSE
jgi:hypothetical protein